MLGLLGGAVTKWLINKSRRRRWWLVIVSVLCVVTIH